MKQFSSILLFFICMNGYGQAIIDFDKIAPPTPEAAHLQKEVKIPVDLSTGIPNISIPLFVLKTGNIQVPVSISYHASGIRVGQLSSSVGLGWGLTAGGGVQRTIRGKTDDLGWLQNNYTSHFINSLTAEGTVIANDYMLSDYDFSQDDYSYNFLEFGGSFFFDSTKTIRNVEKDQIALEYTFPNNTKFKAKDFSGFTYYFDSTDYSASTSYPSNNPSDTRLLGGITSWKLTKIKYHEIDSVQLDYEKDTLMYEQNGADLYDLNLGFSTCAPVAPGCQICGDDYATNVYNMESIRYYESSFIKQILSRDTKIEFYYSDATSATIWKRKLDSISVTSLFDNTIIKKVFFTYSLFTGNGQLKLTSVKNMDLTTGAFEETKFQYHENSGIPLPGIDSRAKDMFGYFNNASNSSLIVTNDVTYTSTFANADRNINSSVIMLGSLKTVTHSTGGYSEFVYEPNKVNSTTYGAGMRLKELKEYNAVNGKLSRTSYEYYGYHGQTVLFPYYMNPIVQQVTYNRRIFSSDEPNSYSIPLGVMPSGYGYDSVVSKIKGDGQDLLTTNKYNYYIIYNGYKTIPKEITNYKYDAGLAMYKPISKDTFTYSHTVDQSHLTPLYGIMRPTLELLANFSDVAVLCKQTTSFYLQYSYAENTILKTKAKSIVYQDNNALTSETRYYYANSTHRLPTRIVKLNSTDSTITTVKYPHEMVASGLDPNGVYQSMINKRLWSPAIIEEVFDKQTNSVAKKITAYKQWTGFIAPELFQSAIKGNTPETRKQIHAYDAFGNILEYSQDNYKSSIQWNFTKTLPVAIATNANVADMAYEDFETTESNWDINGGSYTTTYAITGKKSFVIGAGHSIESLGHTSGNFIVSYWSRNGSLSVNSATASAGITKNGWTYFEHKLTGVTNIVITGNSTIDGLRLYPENAMMTTYSYDPLKGLTSVCDARNNILYYEYDGMRRLSVIRDIDKNVVKKINYSITQSGSPTIYYNELISGDYTKQGCGSGYAGSLVTFVIPAGKYSSSVSQAGANAQATLEVSNLGQIYANENGTCVAVCVPACSYPTRLCINGVCVRGTLVYTSSVYNSGTGMYDCYYHYEWSNGFQTASFYVESPSPCL